MVFDSTSLMLIRHDSVDHKGFGDGHKAWGLLQKKFRSNETVTGSLVAERRQGTPRLFHKNPRALQSLEQAGEHLSEPLLNAMVLNGLPERYEHFVVQESFNPAGSIVELRTQLTNYEESRLHRESVDDVVSHVAMTAKRTRPKHNSSKYNAAPE